MHAGDNRAGAMDFNDLTLFVRIARLASISAAARDLGITPAAAWTSTQV